MSKHIMKSVLVTLLLLAGAVELLAQTVPPATAESENRLIAVLKSNASRKEKADACRQLSFIGTKKAVAALAALLGDEEMNHMARYGLEPIDDPSVDEALLTAVGELKGRPLVGVIGSLGVRRCKDAVPVLSALLHNQDGTVAQAASRALGSIGTREAAQALTRALLADSNTTHAMDRYEGLMRCAEQLAADGDRREAMGIYDHLRQLQGAPHQVRGGALRGAIIVRGADGVKLLRESLRSEDYIIFSAAVQTAMELELDGITNALAAALGGLSTDNRIMVLQAMGKRGDHAAMPVLTSASKEGPLEVRLAAIHAMTEIGHFAALAVLVGLTNDSDSTVARVSRECLATLPGEGVDIGVMGMLNSTSTDEQLMALDLIGRRRMTSAVPALLAVSRGSNGRVRTGALRAVGDLGSPSDLPALLDIMLVMRESRDLDAARQALTALCAKAGDAETCTDRLTALLGDANADQKVALIRVLGGIADAKSFEAVHGCLKDENTEVQNAALRALADWPDGRPTQVLLDVFDSADSEARRAVALRGCTRLLGQGYWSAADTLAACAKLISGVQDASEKRLVLGCLAKVPDAGAIKLVEPMLSDDSVKTEAELAIVGVAKSITGSDRDQARAAAERMIAQSSNETVRNQARDVLAEMEKFEDYITTWQFAGPYEKGNDFAALLDVAFAPEKQAADASWRNLLPGGGDRPWMLSLGTGNVRVAYVRTWVYSENDRDVRLEFGTDDGNKVWLNGNVVHANGAGGAATPGEHKVDASLKKGANSLMLKVTQDSGPWEFCFRIRNRDGSRAEGIRIVPSPPK